MRLLLLYLLIPLASLGQMPSQYTPKGHSHNDYAGKQPFTLAYSFGFGSIEADIFLDRDTLWVGHVAQDIQQHRSLEDLYLRPLEERVKSNKGQAYPSRKEVLQMMIDIKTAAGPTLDALIREIQRHPDLVHARGLTWVVSGSRPPDSTYNSYPPFIHFDGDITRAYDKVPLARIPMMSGDLVRLRAPRPLKAVPYEGPLDQATSDSLKNLIQGAHQKSKKVRFWNAPDDPVAWKLLLDLGVDYLNTDKVEELARYFIREAR